MPAEMNNFWPAGVVLLGAAAFFFVLQKVSAAITAYKTTLHHNEKLREELYDFTVKYVQLETALAVARAESNGLRKQLQHLTNAAIVLAGNRRIRRQDVVHTEGYAFKFEAVQRRRHHLAASLEAQLSELISTTPPGDASINLALMAMVRQAIEMSKEDPEFELHPEGKPDVPRE